MKYKIASIIATLSLLITGIAAGGQTFTVNTVTGDQMTVYGPTHISLHSSVIINAPIEAVWDITMEKDKVWSPTYYKFEGIMEDGAPVIVTTRNPTNANMGKDFVLPYRWSYVQGHRFGWSGPSALGLPTFDNHQFIMVALDKNKTLFTQTNDITSNDIQKLDLSSKAVIDRISSRFKAFSIPFNDALKQEAEKRFKNK